MKLLRDVDRINTYKIEAARFSYVMFRNSWQLLQAEVNPILRPEEVDEAKAVAITTAALAVVDHAMRFCNLITQIRGMKKAEPGISAIYKIKKSLEDVRNHIQHVDQSAHKADPEFYPILGAVSWASSDGSHSFTASLGTMPPGTTFHTLSYDQEQKGYVGGITLCVGTFDLQLEKVAAALEAGEAQLSRWLTAMGHLSDEDLPATSFVMGPLIGTEQRFVRGKFLVNEEAT